MAKNQTKQKHISTQLLVVLIPLVVAAIAIVTIMLAVQAKNVIVDEATAGLHQESRANAADIAKTIAGMTKYYNGVADVMEKSYYTDGNQINNVLIESLNEYPGVEEPNFTMVAVGFQI